jgi:hypothetical protein
MRSPRRLAALLPLVTAVTLGAGLVACSIGGDDETRVSFSSSDTARALALGEGDVAVTSTDNAVVLALVGDTVRMQLSDSLRRSVAADVDSSLTKETGALGGMIARTVGKTVAGAMGFVVRIPVQEVENVRYEDGRIRFESEGNVKFSMGDRSNRSNRTDGDEKGSGARFSEQDGRRFVEAVRARQSARASGRTSNL